MPRAALKDLFAGQERDLEAQQQHWEAADAAKAAASKAPVPIISTSRWHQDTVVDLEAMSRHQRLRHRQLTRQQAVMLNSLLRNWLQGTDFTPRWLAAFLDGNGWIGIVRRRNPQTVVPQYQLVVALSQCSYELLHNLQRILGGTNTKRIPKQQGHRLQYALVLNGLKAVTVLQLLKDNCEIKAHKAQVGI